MTIYSLKRPTRLYIKKCSHCELLYFGKTTFEDIEKYVGSGIRWKNHLKKYEATPINIWVSEWFTDSSIVEVATKFSQENNIIESKLWANLSIENGISGGYLGETIHKKAMNSRKKTIDNPEWKKTTGKSLYEKATINTDYELRTKNTDYHTIGKNVSKTMCDPIWKETVGKNLYIKASKKQKKTKADPKWKEQNSKTCEYCGLKCLKTNYIRFHGEKCKRKNIL